MLLLTVPTICLSLAAGVLAGKAEIFVREGGSYPDTPNGIVSAHSRIACSLRCTALEEWRCGGFSYLTNGTCLLWKAGCLSTPPENSTSGQPALYRRPAPSSCPGWISDPCGCPLKFYRCAGRCLRRPETWSNYTSAGSRCARIGAHLVTPRTKEEDVCATRYPDTWLGYRGEDTEESFVGADGCGPITYSNWADGEPAFDEDDNCVRVNEGGQWMNNRCGKGMDVLCQLENCHRPECSE